jgi:hypothetical protein
MVNVISINNHEVPDIAIGTCGAIIDTQFGPIIAIMYQYALWGQGQSIHLVIQLEH